MPETGRQDIEERQDKQDWRKHGWLDNFTFHLVDTPNWRIEPFQVCEDLMEYLHYKLVGPLIRLQCNQNQPCSTTKDLS